MLQQRGPVWRLVSPLARLSGPSGADGVWSWPGVLQQRGPVWRLVSPLARLSAGAVAGPAAGGGRW